MNEFIVWDKINNKFPQTTEIKFYNCGVGARRKPYVDENVKWISCGVNPKDMEVFKSIGRTDINGKKIYADCSIVEFDFKFGDETESQKIIGYFHWCSERLRYIIQIKPIGNLNYVLYTQKVFIKSNVSKMSNFKIIGTLQENPELLES